MKDVLYYSTLTGHEISDDVVVVGLCPSSNDVRSRSDTYWRLKNWMNIVGQYAYDFYNVIPDIVDAEPKMANVNLEDINTKLSKFRDKKVIALGNFPSKVLDKLGMKTLPAVGTVVEITARAVVQSVSTYERQDGEPSRDVGLQITDLDVTAEGDQSSAQRMYANSGMNA